MRVTTKTTRLGEVNKANNGMLMTIVAYRNSKDIDIQFEDGTIVNNKLYKLFLNGQVKHPKLDSHTLDRTGEKSIAKNGLSLTLVKYRSNRDIDVQFEDGVLVQHTSYRSFKQGAVRHPNIKTNIINRLGETKVANNGMEMTIISYRNTRDIDVQFEDGTIIYNCTYKRFKDGYIKHPNMKYKQQIKDRTGETVILPDGNIAKIIVYRNCNDIDIKLCSGTIIKHQKYNYVVNKLRLDKKKYIKDRTGEVGRSLEGMPIIIVGYRLSTDIDIQFEDGTVVEHTTYEAFSKGCIKYRNRGKRSNFKDRTGEQAYNNGKELMTIIKYRGADDVDIQFEDGTIVYNKAYSDFIKGNLRNPSLRYSRMRVDRIGETAKAYNGQAITIINYRGTRDVDIQFEDGCIVEHTDYDRFKKGKIANPKYSRIIKLFECKGVGYYKCTCKACKKSYILTPEELKNFECTH